MPDCQHQSHGLKESGVQNQRQPNAEEREKLLDALTDCLDHMETDSDVEALERRLAELDPDDTMIEGFDVERSLDEFHQKYGTPDSPTPAQSDGTKAAQKKSPIWKRYARIAIIAAVLCSLILAAQANGFNFFQAIAQWTSAQFHLEWLIQKDADTNDTNSAQLQSLRETLDFYGISVPLIPNELPEGSELEKISTREEREYLLITADYKIPNGSMFITIRSKTEVTPFSEVEKNDEDVEIYDVGGIEHHIMTDVAMTKAVWQNGEWECRITGDLSRDELYTMIDSIYE